MWMIADISDEFSCPNLFSSVGHCYTWMDVVKVCELNRDRTQQTHVCSLIV